MLNDAHRCPKTVKLLKGKGLINGFFLFTTVLACGAKAVVSQAQAFRHTSVAHKLCPKSPCSSVIDFLYM